MSVKRHKLMPITLEKGVQFYLSTLETEGKSPRYIDWLKTRLGFFLKFIHLQYGETFMLQDLAVEDGREFVCELLDCDTIYRDHPLTQSKSGKLAIQYLHGCERAVRSFSFWAYEEGYLDENVMHRLKLPQLPKTQPESLSEEEIRKGLAVCLDPTLESLRNYSMFMLFFDTGLRLSELVNLRLSKIDFALGEMSILGKGNKERRIPVDSQAKKALIDYLSKGRLEPKNPLDEDRVYLNADGYPISHNVVEKVSQRVRKAAGVSRLHPHLCRHTFSVRYLIHEGDVFSLQKIMGHSSLEMTRKYVNLATGDVKEKYLRFSPMDKPELPGQPAGTAVRHRQPHQNLSLIRGHRPSLMDTQENKSRSVSSQFVFEKRV